MKDNDEKKSTRINRDQIVTIGDLELFKKSLVDELKLLVESVAGSGEKKWLRSSEVRKMLGISTGTLQNFRINRLLPFVRINKLIYYKYEDVEKMLSQKK
jgi:Helix-turn-helix domain